MTLSIHNLLTHYVIHPHAPELEKWEQAIALISSIGVGILTCGLVHLSVFVQEKLEKQHATSTLLSASILTGNTYPQRPHDNHSWLLQKLTTNSYQHNAYQRTWQLPALKPPLSPYNPYPELTEIAQRPRGNGFSQASFDAPSRLLLLDGDDGTVACRIHGPLMSGTIPKFSDNGTLESASRSLLRMNNLVAVRGGAPGASMIGPIDYLGNLQEPHRYLYTIQNGTPPVYYRKLITPTTVENNPNLQPFDNNLTTTINANWISGGQADILERQAEYHVTPRQLRQSLFLNPGILEVDRGRIELNHFDPRGIDLSSFKARLVENTTPFQITKREFTSKDDYRLVTYMYEPGYADWQVQNGSGLFLEKHDFSQTITPATAESKGFVTLGRTNEQLNQLELIGIQIPYGYTLIIEEDCIHGDTTLNGLYMMGMTSDHTTMRTADTVFLKNPETRENVNMVIVDPEENQADPVPNPLPNPPYVLYRNAPTTNRQEFRQLTRGQNFVFNPFSQEYWNYLRGS